MSTTREYRGWLGWTSNGEENDLLGLGAEQPEPQHSLDGRREILAELVAHDMAQFGNYLTVSYYTTPTEMSADQAEDAWLRRVFGPTKALYRIHHEGITSYQYTAEDLIVGGLDLINELKSHVGDFLHMEITYEREQWGGTPA